MKQVARHGGVLAVHGEDDELVMYNYLLAQQRGQWDWHNVHLIHSKLVEELAFQQIVRLAARTGGILPSPLHLFRPRMPRSNVVSDRAARLGRVPRGYPPSSGRNRR